MREESHLDDMRAAIRGDFERLAERRGSQELMREDVGDAQEPASQLEPEHEPAQHPAHEPELEHEPEPVQEPEPELAEAHAAEPPSGAGAESEAHRKSWLARVLGL